MRKVDGVGGAEGDNFTETLTGCTTLSGDFVGGEDEMKRLR